MHGLTMDYQLNVGTILRRGEELFGHKSITSRLPNKSWHTLQETGTKFWGQGLPAFTPGALISHVLMIFNLNGDWIHKINPPFWSVATEWQIYFLMPLLFLPLLRMARQWGVVALVAGAFLAGLLPHLLLKDGAWGLAEARPLQALL